MLTDDQWHQVTGTRLRRPAAVAEALASRPRRSLLGDDGHLFLVAADHPARGAPGIGADPLAMADRRDLLGRLVTALDHPRVDGVMASVDVLDDLALLGALDNKVVVGSMNRGGLLGASFELDDRMTSFSAAALADAGYDGGKVLLRIDDDDPGTLDTMTAVAAAVGELADRRLMAMVEPLPYRTDPGTGRSTLTTDDAALIRCVGIASALGTSSAYTWLKLPAWGTVETVAAATSMPILLLGGSPSGDPEADRARWRRALAVDHVRGYTIGRSLLYPPDGDVRAAIAAAARILNDAVAAKTGPVVDPAPDPTPQPSTGGPR